MSLGRTEDWELLLLFSFHHQHQLDVDDGLFQRALYIINIYLSYLLLSTSKAFVLYAQMPSLLPGLFPDYNFMYTCKIS